MANPLTLSGQRFETPIKDGKDSYAYRFGLQENPVYIENCVFDGQAGEWGCKNSGCLSANIVQTIFKNGTERAYDQVRGGNIRFKSCVWTNNVRPVTKSRFSLSKCCDIGIKGGAENIIFEDCIFTDILLGDYSIYNEVDGPENNRVATITFINCKNINGGPIIVRALHANMDTIKFVNTPAQIFKVPDFGVWVYWQFNRKFGDKRPPATS